MPSDDEIFQTRFALLEAVQWTGWEPDPENPDEAIQTRGWRFRVFPATQDPVHYESLDAIILDRWELTSVLPKEDGRYGSSQSYWFKRPYEEFVFGDP